MQHLPANLSPEAAAWLQAQVVIHNARSAALLRAEIKKVDDWACSIFAALRDALGHAMFDVPQLKDSLAADWACDAQDFEQVRKGGKAKHHPSATADELEARALLHLYFVRLGMFPKP